MLVARWVNWVDFCLDYSLEFHEAVRVGPEKHYLEVHAVANTLSIIIYIN